MSFGLKIKLKKCIFGICWHVMLLPQSQAKYFIKLLCLNLICEKAETPSKTTGVEQFLCSSYSVKKSDWGEKYTFLLHIFFFFSGIRRFSYFDTVASTTMNREWRKYKILRWQNVSVCCRSTHLFWRTNSWVTRHQELYASLGRVRWWLCRCECDWLLISFPSVNERDR